jgi:hypothetical protein
MIIRKWVGIVLTLWEHGTLPCRHECGSASLFAGSSHRLWAPSQRIWARQAAWSHRLWTGNSSCLRASRWMIAGRYTYLIVERERLDQQLTWRQCKRQLILKGVQYSLPALEQVRKAA